jgi:4-hydroxybenzoate polyprenyltransferase
LERTVGAPVPAGAGKRGVVSAFWAALRPKHWIKNAFVLAPVVFAGRLDDLTAVSKAMTALAVFCALSSTVYLINDIADREADRLHPKKRNRPIAAGEVGVPVAALTAGLLALGGLSIAAGVSPGLAGVSGLYLVQNLAYSFYLKRVVILDVMLVASGFLLRAWAGAVAVEVEISHWLVLCTGLLALFLGFVKRRQEMVAAPGATGQRPILREYSLPFLDQMIAVVTGSVVTSYALYAFSDEVAAKLGTRHLGLTIPFVLFGIFRYLSLVHLRGEGDNPTALVLSDKPLLINVFLWAGAVGLVLYVWR